MLCITLVGGVAVLGSYAHGLWAHPESGARLWGNVPQALLPFYQVNMLLATAGYFAFTYFLLFRADPDQVRVAATFIRHSFRFSLFNLLYVLILAPSALWMPLTSAMLKQPGSTLWLGIRVVLAVAGLASLGLLGALVGLRPRTPRWAYWLAVVGSVPFCIQTALLDALVWPVFFPLQAGG